MGKKESVISIENVFKSFGPKNILRGVDLELYKGENLVVLGRSGTGKSVLIKIISGLLYQYANHMITIEKDELYELIYTNVLLVIKHK